MTGFRKMYCVGLKWCDGHNLQLMLGIQGLYHDCDERYGWNFVLARYRRLCCLGSVAVVLLQMTLPLCLATGESAAPKLGFALAMSFHASNHILWRINFFVAWCPSLLALLAPTPQANTAALYREIVHEHTALAPALLVAFYLLLQLGHALDLASEKLLAMGRRALEAKEAEEEGEERGGLVKPLLRGVIWLLEMHCLGDYYSSYWPTTHPLAATPVVCVCAVWSNGDECLLPAVTDFYWRRVVGRPMAAQRDGAL
mmetsp:Transcript_26001/g.87761  ORF Transcript_26001/g.87761 Transcript_26001/m.87761 type:complete len:256 (+) Transcript_26001:146-913(+)